MNLIPLRYPVVTLPCRINLIKGSSIVSRKFRIFRIFSLFVRSRKMLKFSAFSWDFALISFAKISRINKCKNFKWENAKINYDIIKLLMLSPQRREFDKLFCAINCCSYNTLNLASFSYFFDKIIFAKKYEIWRKNLRNT